MKSISRILFYLAASVSMAVAPAFAADIQIIHKPLAPEALPSPGKKLKLTLQLKNTKDFQRPLRARFVRDGQLFESVLAEGFLNEYDVPTYVFETTAPEGELTYSFSSIPNDEPTIQSPTFRITRRCIEDLTISPPEETENFEQRVQNLAIYAVSLEKNVEALGSALNTLEELEKLINE